MSIVDDEPLEVLLVTGDRPFLLVAGELEVGWDGSPTFV